MGNNIFNISQEYLDIMSLIEANDGEVTEEIQESLKINKDELDQKFDAYAYIISIKQSNNNLLKDEIDRLKSLQRTNDTIIKRLKDTMIETMRVLELNGKSGNLAYRTEFHNFFTRETEAVELVEEVISEDNLRIYMEEYGDILTYKISKPLTKEQIEIIESNLLKVNRYEGFALEASISKTKFKEAIKDYEEIEFDKLGKIVNNTSLTIK